jgi:hypothetical protein
MPDGLALALGGDVERRSVPATVCGVSLSMTPKSSVVLLSSTRLMLKYDTSTSMASANSISPLHEPGMVVNGRCVDAEHGFVLGTKRVCNRFVREADDTPSDA